MRGRGGWGFAWLILGCQPNTAGIGSTSANTLGSADSAESGDTATDTTNAVSDDADADAGMTAASGPPDDTAGPADESTSGEPSTSGGDAPLLSISDGPTFDYGPVTTNTQTSHMFVVTNEGYETATGLGGSLSPQFTFPGGFPGAGTCAQVLAPATSCTVEVVFAPSVLGLHAGALAVSYAEGPDATRELIGDAIGQSSNLLMNPGGEDTGNPPPSWTDAGPGNWRAGDPWGGNPTPRSGTGHLLAFDGPSNQDYSLIQDIDVAHWAATIDSGTLRFSFLGYARSYQLNDDNYRIRVVYLDAGDNELESWSTGLLTANSWQSHEDTRVAPSGTRTVRVDLGCRKGANVYCDAFFDDLDLHAVHP